MYECLIAKTCLLKKNNKTKPDDATDNILKRKASINWSVLFKYYYYFRHSKTNFVLQFIHY